MINESQLSGRGGKSSKKMSVQNHSFEAMKKSATVKETKTMIKFKQKRQKEELFYLRSESSKA